MKRKYALGGILTAVLAGALVYYYGGSKVPPGQLPLQRITLQNENDLISAFNADEGEVRVLLFFSPT